MFTGCSAILSQTLTPRGDTRGIGPGHFAPDSLADTGVSAPTPSPLIRAPLARRCRVSAPSSPAPARRAMKLRPSWRPPPVGDDRPRPGPREPDGTAARPASRGSAARMTPGATSAPARPRRGQVDLAAGDSMGEVVGVDSHQVRPCIWWARSSIQGPVLRGSRRVLLRRPNVATSAGRMKSIGGFAPEASANPPASAGPAADHHRGRPADGAPGPPMPGRSRPALVLQGPGSSWTMQVGVRPRGGSRRRG